MSKNKGSDFVFEEGEKTSQLGSKCRWSDSFKQQIKLNRDAPDPNKSSGKQNKDILLLHYSLHFNFSRLEKRRI